MYCLVQQVKKETNHEVRNYKLASYNQMIAIQIIGIFFKEKQPSRAKS